MPEIYHRLEVKVPTEDGGYTTRVIKLDYTENISGKPLVFLPRSEFPTVGRENFLYVATDENQIYYFDTDSGTYETLAANFDTINEIDGGDATSF